MPSSAPRCRSSARSYAKRSTCGRIRGCSTSLPETATSPSPPRAAGATWSRPTTCPHCLIAPVNAPMPIVSNRIPRGRCGGTAVSRWSFDVVVSTFGVMFTPDQDRAAAEMARVCKRGGKIGLANWTPDGFIGQLFKTSAGMCPRHPVSNRRQCGARAVGWPNCSSRMRRPSRRFNGTSCSDTAQPSIGWRSSGPTTVRCSRPSQHSRRRRNRLLSKISCAWSGNSIARETGCMVVPSEYLEVVITRH